MHPLLSSTLALTTSAPTLQSFAPDPGTGLGAGGAVLITILGLLYVAFFAAMIWVYATIIRKAGYSGWYVLVLFVPIVNLVYLVLFAVKEWPVQQRLRQLQGIAGGAPQPGFLPAGPGSGGYGY